MSVRWPWKKKALQDRFVVSWWAGTFAYLQARAVDDGSFAIQKMGVVQQGAAGREELVQRLRGLGLKGLTAHGMLRPEQYQLLQIDVPPVSPEEMRAAARYQIRDMVNAHIDDITLDVMRVGDGMHKGPNHLFVVAAQNDVIRELNVLGDALNWEIPVIDIQETAQRNLQSLLSKSEGSLDRADAALMIVDERQALLTISANEELFFTRRLDLPQGFLTMRWSADADTFQDTAADSFDSVPHDVQEYVPSYATDAAPAAAQPGDAERVQRLVVEVQRSLDLWDRTWSSMPLASLRVYAGGRSQELASWLGREIGQVVTAMDLHSHFTGLDHIAPDDQLLAMPLLGVLLRTETRKL